MAINAAISAYKMTYVDPMKENASAQFVSYNDAYTQRWAFYTNSIFDRSHNNWTQLARNYNLYNKIRSIINPVPATVNFYAQAVYPGGLSPDGKRLPDDVPTAMPFPDDTDENLMAAIAQIWQWSNWSVGKSILVKNCAALGDYLVEVVDDVERGKVYFDASIWPGYVTDLTLDPQGNVKDYMLEYQTTDKDGRNHKYRKVVTKEFFTEYLDDQVVSDYDNPYGFVPAYWFKHSDIGGKHGQPAFNSYTTLMELNSRMAHVSDHIGKKIGAPSILGNIKTPAQIVKLFDTTNQQAKARQASDYAGPDAPNSNADSMYILTTPDSVDIKPLSGDLNIADALEFMKAVADEVDARNPEITFWDKVADMNVATGPGIDRISGNVKGLVWDAAAIYDKGNISLAQMATAIAGFRAREGRAGWSRRTRQQQKFNLFDLQSYERGDLDFSFAPRPLIAPTALEKAQEKQQYWAGITSETGAGIPLEVALEDDGWTPEKLARIEQAKAKTEQAQVDNIRRQQVLAAQDTPPQLPQGRTQ
ncbi:MAG: hypothetical protein BGO39_28640 [Chloroflexi bacterium 54-19]|nr:MAG: hypothetical protein BGO39_28640 [Chloroflexi bacterium 54-19]